LSSNSNSKKAASTPLKGGSGSKSKTGRLFYLVILVLFVFLTLSILTFRLEEAPGSDLEGRSRGWLGQVGGTAAYLAITLTFGRWGSLAVPIVLGLILAGRISRWKFKPWRWMFITIVTGFFIGFGDGVVRHFLDRPAELIASGWLPLRMVEISIYYLYGVGTVLLSSAVLAALAVILCDFPLTDWLERIFYQWPKSLIAYVRDNNPKPQAEEDLPFDLEDDDDPIPSRYIPASPPTRDLSHLKPVPVKKPPHLEEGSVVVAQGRRELPPLSLLNPPANAANSLTQSELEENSRRLQEKLGSLGVSAKVIKTNPGPVITRYDLEPSADVKVSRIAGLSDDIAMALRAKGIRILAPIPGEAAVGVEIPNWHPETVFIREALGSDDFRNARTPLTVALGKDASGRIFLADLARMPHLLVAGATGSGKSVCINVLLMSLLYRSDPNDLRLVLIDPKKLELSLYSRLAEQHLISPPGVDEDVITTPENAVLALKSVHAEMARRYDILSEVGVRSLDEYTRWRVLHPAEVTAAEGKRPHLPYIVVIIDELADLMMTVRREFEELVVRLAQMSRAVGIHLVVATQRPSVDVVTGLIKANFPARIAFQVAARPDSRTILDNIGAEALLGRGDMLFMAPGSGHLQRVHGALVTTEEVERVVEFIRAQPPASEDFRLPDPELTKIKPGGVEAAGGVNSSDEYFEEAARIVVKVDQGSVSILQRRLRVGYSRAARLIDELEQAGIVGPFDGSKARQVLVTPEELEERYGITI
jgi:S-DNA-T family DNA segregation ATPase FtsK/SpoIIIE